MEKRKPGRPKKIRAPQDYFASAEEYLRAVVYGTTPPDSVRVMAAKTLIAYEKSKCRVPVESLAPREIRKKALKDIETSRLVDFEKKAAKIRKKFEERNEK